MKKYEQVICKVNESIKLGILKDGDRLPSIRSLAKQMCISNMTVLEGYKRLESMGIIEGRPQSGFYVRPEALRVPNSQLPLLEAGQSQIALKTEIVTVSDAVRRLAADSMRNDVVPLGTGIPNQFFLPNDELTTHLARIARQKKKDLNLYICQKGHEDLLEIISIRMLEMGCVVQRDDLIITSGGTQAITQALRAVTRPGDTVAVESPGYYGFYFIMQYLNLNAVEIPSDPQTGLDVNALDSIIRKGLAPACVLLSANFSNPTGALMPDENKQKLVELCSRHNLPIIEDDTYGELPFNSLRPQPLQAITPNTVIYISSFSKILAPGYRVAWIVGNRYADDIRRCFGMSVLAIPTVTQLALASFLKSGALKRHLRRLRKQYEYNIKLFQNCVAQYFPNGTRFCDPKGGQFLWVELPYGLDAVVLSEAAIKDNISIAPGVLFSSREHYKNCFRLNCSVPWGDEVENAIIRLGELAKQQGVK